MPTPGSDLGACMATHVEIIIMWRHGGADDATGLAELLHELGADAVGLGTCTGRHVAGARTSPPDFSAT